MLKYLTQQEIKKYYLGMYEIDKIFVKHLSVSQTSEILYTSISYVYELTDNKNHAKQITKARCKS